MYIYMVYIHYIATGKYPYVRPFTTHIEGEAGVLLWVLGDNGQIIDGSWIIAWRRFLNELQIT